MNTHSFFTGEPLPPDFAESDLAEHFQHMAEADTLTTQGETV